MSLCSPRWATVKLNFLKVKASNSIARRVFEHRSMANNRLAHHAFPADNSKSKKTFLISPNLFAMNCPSTVPDAQTKPVRTVRLLKLAFKPITSGCIWCECVTMSRLQLPIGYNTNKIQRIAAINIHWNEHVSSRATFIKVIFLHVTYFDYLLRARVLFSTTYDLLIYFSCSLNIWCHFQLGFFFVCSIGLDVDDLYSREIQRKTCSTILQSKPLCICLIPDKGDFFLSRGHLAARSDFIYYSHQRATFYFLNAAPQWQTFNGGNWAILEEVNIYNNQTVVHSYFRLDINFHFILV